MMTRFVAAVVLLAAVFLAAPAQASNRYASIVIDADTGRVIHASNPDKRLFPASLTKMMTLYMLFEALEEGRVSMDTRMRVSQRAAGQRRSRLGIPTGGTITVDMAIRVLVVRSANDISTVVAEQLAGTEVEFARRMTDRARQLGMSNTTFRNASGLPNTAQVSTARNIARLAVALRRDFPQHYHYFQVTSFRYNGQTYNTHNRMLTSYHGADGLKTGYIRTSGFNLATSATRNGTTLIGVVFGGSTAQGRDAHMVKLLDRSFAQMTQMAAVPLPESKPGQPGSQASAATQSTSLAPAPTLTPPASVTPAFGGEQGFPADTLGNRWGIQVGAYSAFTTARQQAELAAHRLQASYYVVMPHSKANGVLLYRARVIGLESETTARNACQVISPESIDLAQAPGFRTMRD